MSDETELDVTDLDRYMGVPMEPGLLKEPVATNDIRRWVQAMHYPNPLHYDEHWAAASRFGDLVAPQSFTVACDTSHGCSPAQVGKIPESHLIFGGDDWWFFGPRIWPAGHAIVGLRLGNASPSNGTFTFGPHESAATESAATREGRFMARA